MGVGDASAIAGTSDAVGVGTGGGAEELVYVLSVDVLESVDVDVIDELVSELVSEELEVGSMVCVIVA